MLSHKILCGFFGFFLFLAGFSHATEWVDLTHSFDSQTIYWPTEKGFQIEKRAGFTKKGYFYAANLFSAPEHGGTHLDAPYHFAKGKNTVDQIPLSQLTGNLAVIDIRDKVGANADYQISKEDINDWEKQHGPLTHDDIVLFNTGWARFWENKKKYLGSDNPGDILNLHFPGISPKAAQHLKAKKIKGVGLDTASLDYGASRDFKAHRILLGANIYGLENVTNLNQLPPRSTQIIVAPMKIAGGTGAPSRIFVKRP